GVKNLGAPRYYEVERTEPGANRYVLNVYDWVAIDVTSVADIDASNITAIVDNFAPMVPVFTGYFECVSDDRDAPSSAPTYVVAYAPTTRQEKTSPRGCNTCPI